MGLQPTQGHENSRSPTDLSSRPKRSEVERSAVLRSLSKHALGMFSHHEPRVPHIWPGFGQMWELADAGARVPVAPEKFPFESS
jgi:hypothetical protein